MSVFLVQVEKWREIVHSNFASQFADVQTSPGTAEPCHVLSLAVLPRDLPRLRGLTRNRRRCCCLLRRCFLAARLVSRSLLQLPARDHQVRPLSPPKK